MNMFLIIRAKPVPAGLTILMTDLLVVQTQCRCILCNNNYRVSDHICIECPPGTYNTAGDDASGPDTSCDILSCVENEYVSNHMCQACPSGTYNAAGDLKVVPTPVCDRRHL